MPTSPRRPRRPHLPESQAHTRLLQGQGISAEVSWHAQFLQHVLEFGTELLRRDLRVVSPPIVHG
jgi:hypothetical protein